MKMNKIVAHRKKSPHRRLSLLQLFAALLLAGLWALPAMAEDADYPHNYVMNASCSTGACHFAPYDDNMCLACHDGSFATPEVSHSSTTTSNKYGDWAMQCRTCHNPHLQAQYWAYGTDSYFLSGFSDPGGITGTTLTMSGATWEENSLVGMVLFPNVDDYQADWNNYGIVANTADTITVAGPMNLPEISDGNKNFAVIYGQLARNLITTPNSGSREVRLFRATGANSFADGNATYDGVCEVCHTQTAHHRNDGSGPQQSHFDGTRCTSCHAHENGFAGLNHTTAGFVLPVAECLECHGTPDSDLVGSVHGNDCGLCHVDPQGAGPLFEPYETNFPNGGSCTDCHDGGHPHPVAANSGSVTLFADNAHDSAGWVGSSPYFEVDVNCSTCHTSDLVPIHGNDCATCHPSPRDTLGTWNGGCDQVGCHPVYHPKSIQAHLPFENPYLGPEDNDCNRCHEPFAGPVLEDNCLNCHADYGPTDNSAPTTTSNALATYDGPARIDFSISDNDKVGLGRTFYSLDGGAATAAGKELFVTAAGAHELQFWSIDQSGNTETTPQTVYFTISADTTPPVTTSDAQANYNDGAVITLTATDASTLGVKNTYYQLNADPVQTGTQVIVPTSSGDYTLRFWSEDWTGNVETEHNINFTVTIASADATLSLVWGDSDASGSPCGDDPEAEAHWIIRNGATVLATGSGACSNWSGVDNVVVPVSATPYTVIINWWDSYYQDWDQTTFFNVAVTSPGQVVRLAY